jgi:hypothetical protein
MDVDSLEFVLQGIAFGTHGFVAPVCHIFRLVNGGESTIQLVMASFSFIWRSIFWTFSLKV